MAGVERTNTFRVTIFSKMIVYFLAVSLIPLLVLGYFGNKNLTELGLLAIQSLDDMGEKDLKSARTIGERAIEDSVQALDAKSTEAIEVRTVELAGRIAEFLYERDRDISLLAAFTPDPHRYLDAYSVLKKDVVVPRAPSNAKSEAETEDTPLLWENPENRQSWRHRRPDDFQRVSMPLYKEITFVDLSGMERIKIADGRNSDDLRDVSIRENTYCKAEDYFSHLSGLGKGEIYVSRVVGAYVKGWLYETDTGPKVKPESAYAGKENPGGSRFQGIIRWATPVYKDGAKVGYLTMALDHVHIMEFTDHVIPTDERFCEMSDAASGNYAFLWDFEDRSISHPRHFFICGHDPRTGAQVPGWVSEETYEEFKAGGLSLEEFVRKLPSFREFTQRKKGSKVQLESGDISLDCRVLDTAPQCQGWHQGTEDGGSGSFVILWSGLWKFTSYAAVPYYTGMYGKSKRGFGYVTVGANVPDFHKAAHATKDYIEEVIAEKSVDIESRQAATRLTVGQTDERNRNLLTAVVVFTGLTVGVASVVMSLGITRPIRSLTDGALAISRGELHQRIKVKSRDELKQLADTFNEMAAAVAEVDRMKSDFVSTASHELRTPIHSMLLVISGTLAGYSGPISDELREDLETVEGELTRLTRLVNNLLDLSRIEARRVDIAVRRTSVEDIVDAAIKEVSGLIEARGHSVWRKLDPRVPEIEVDRDRMIQVLVNLLSNSIKYGPDGGTIIVTSEARTDEVLFTVADNGYGVPPWARHKIFEKFFQADSIMSQRVGGSGLGLTISKEIVEMHAGTIVCESPLEEVRFPGLPLGGERKGTLFAIRLPLRSSIGGS